MTKDAHRLHTRLVSPHRGKRLYTSRLIQSAVTLLNMHLIAFSPLGILTAFYIVAHIGAHIVAHRTVIQLLVPLPILLFIQLLILLPLPLLLSVATELGFGQNSNPRVRPRVSSDIKFCCRAGLEFSSLFDIQH